ncbi:MAG: cupredoxin domain-containing protein [Gaiellaceae bacterium]
MFLKRTLTIAPLALAVGLLAIVAPAAAAPSHAAVVIRHQLRGCHAWSVNDAAFKASQSIALRRGGTIVWTNDDVMSHTLVLTSGPSLRIGQPKLGHMGAALTLRLARPGVYRFTTKPGEDYMSGVKTVGADNVLRLVVVVS